MGDGGDREDPPRCVPERTMVKVTMRRRFVCWAAGMSGAFAVGCGGTIVFHGQKPIGIEGAGAGHAAAPAAPAARVKVGKTKIEISEKIQFADGKATILDASNDLLSEIATALKENPQIKKLLIEGHASSEGNASLNTKLSGERATAVMKWLEAHGVAKGRLSAKGFGSSHPIADNATEEGREKNRRVDFTIVEPRGK